VERAREVLNSEPHLCALTWSIQNEQNNIAF